MKADRLLSIILLLQFNKSMTAKQLAEKLEVSERTIYRDVDSISALGVPIYVNRGRNGGINLIGDYKTSLTGLDINDIQYFSLPFPKKILDDLGLDQPKELSYQKLFSSVSDDVRTRFEGIGNRILIDMESWTRETYHTNTKLINKLQDAIWSNSRTEILYEKRIGAKSYALGPLALVLKRSVWYLIASHDDIIKSYRLDRIRSIKLIGYEFVRPIDFDLEEYWRNNVVKFRDTLPKYNLKIEVDELTFRELRRRKSLRIKDYIINVTNSVTISLEFDIEMEAISFIFNEDFDIRIIEPRSVIEKLKRKSIEILDRYS